MGYETGEAMERLADERDELAAELEQWKTNFSHAMDTANDIYEQKLEVLTELERVKAERDELKANSFSDDLKTMSILAETDQHIKDCKTFLEEFKKLSSLKSRLPVNADGDVVLWGDTQFYIDSTDDSVVNSFAVEEIAREGKSFGFVSMDDVFHLSEECHSTAESCRAANTQED